MPNNRKQHFVPKSYLRAFSVDPDRRSINVHNVHKTTSIQAASLKNQCAKPYFYGRSPTLERAIQAIEGPYAPAVGHLRAGGSVTPAVDLVLRRFMLLQHVRTEVAARDGAEMTMAVLDLPGSDLPVPSPRERIALAVQAAMFEYQQNMRLVDDLKLRILRNTTDRPFVTSDNPAVMTNRLHQQRLAGRTSFGWKAAGAILLMPLAPELAAVLVDGDVYAVQHSGGRVDVSRRSDVDAINEHQFLNLRENAYFAEWRHREFVAESAAAAEPRRPEDRHVVRHAVLEGSDDWGERFAEAPVSDIRDGRKRLVVVRPNRPCPGDWPSMLRFRPRATAWSNGTREGLVRRGLIDMGFVKGTGYRRVRV